MDTSTETRLTAIEAKIGEMHALLKKMRLHSLITFWVSMILIIGPLLLLPFAIPFFLSSLSIPTDPNGAAGIDSATLTELRSLLGI